MPARHRHELRECRLLGEADKPEVRLVHAQEQRRFRPDRALVVGSAGAVRCADLDEARTGAREHVGDAEAVADLEELAARDDHLASLRERCERKQHRSRVVVDDERRLGTGQAPEDRRAVILARAARAVGQVELEVGVAAADLLHLCERLVRQRSAPEIRVHDHAGRIQHAAQARRSCGPKLFLECVLEVSRLRPSD